MAVWSEVKFSVLPGDIRFDAEYYQPKYLQLDNLISDQKVIVWGNIKGEFIVGPFGSAFHVSNYVEHTPYRYIRGRDVKSFFLLDDENCYIPEEHFDRLRKYRLKTGDLLVSVVGTLGKVAIVTDDVGEAIFSCKSTAYRSESINPFYLCAYLNSEIGQAYLQRMVRGHIQTGLNLGDLKSVPVAIPHKELELKISQTVKLAYEQKRKSKQLYTEAETLLLSELGLNNLDFSHKLYCETHFSVTQKARRIDAEYFHPKYERSTNAIRNCSGSWDTLENLVTIRKCVEPGSEAYQESGIPFIRVSNLGKFEINDNNQKYLTEELYNQLRRYQPGQNEILLSKDASPGIAYHLRKEPGKFIPCGGILCLKVRDREKLNEEYLTLVLNSVFIQAQIERDTGGSIIDHWTLPQVKSAIIPLLKKNKQKEIKANVVASFAQRDESKRLLEDAKRMVEEMVLWKRA